MVPLIMYKESVMAKKTAKKISIAGSVKATRRPKRKGSVKKAIRNRFYQIPQGIKAASGPRSLLEIMEAYREARFVSREEIALLAEHQINTQAISGISYGIRLALEQARAKSLFRDLMIRRNEKRQKENREGNVAFYTVRVK